MISMFVNLTTVNQTLVSELMEERAESRRRHEALIREMQEQRSEDRRRMDAQNREIQSLREQVQTLTRQLDERDAFNVADLQTLVDEPHGNQGEQVSSEHHGNQGRQVSSVIQLNDQMGSFEKVHHFFRRQPTGKKVVIVVGGTVICGITVYGLLNTAPGAAILKAISGGGSSVAAPESAGFVRGIGLYFLSRSA
jgi:predicted RNase H-like nuclease (RuvC/YqgF family)